ncbi:hypothetical protein [Persicirhabdus sediminis]|uniref:AhpC/TSA family protein n=1 Tax=Persicirhabdus sediminis TaxID=454144 RepID=A0A8J7MK17_9BACT|nr:hypothetical protein [Persicirhabdus sediminis]MBK1792433.1 hypothetical protein [Persicirhabdus sediminis]
MTRHLNNSWRRLVKLAATLALLSGLVSCDEFLSLHNDTSGETSDSYKAKPGMVSEINQADLNYLVKNDDRIIILNFYSTSDRTCYKNR